MSRRRNKQTRKWMVGMRGPGLCHWCGVWFDKRTVDHVIPLVHLGSNAQENCVPACRECNEKRGKLQNPKPPNTFGTSMRRVLRESSVRSGGILLALCLLAATETPEQRAKRILNVLFTRTLHHMIDTYREPVGRSDVEVAWREYQVGCTSNTTDKRKQDLAATLIAALVRRMDLISRSDK